MKKTFTSILLLFFFLGFSQDILATFSGKRYNVVILSKIGDSIKYREDFSEELPICIKSAELAISKNLVSEIKYRDGTSENFFTEAEKTISKEQLKANIIELISKYVYKINAKVQHYCPVFEGDLMRMPIAKHRSGLRYDFSRVYEFQPVYEQNETDAYLNIVLRAQKNSNKSKWTKHKMVLGVKDHKQAYKILRLLENYNYLLLQQKKAL